MINRFILDDIIVNALKEDNNYLDITTDVLIDKDSKSTAVMTFKEDGVLCGVDIVERVFKLLNESIEVKSFYKDGDYINKGSDAFEIYGSTRDLLKGERIALNLLQRMCGIATMSRRYSEMTVGSTKVVDTRKTTPGLRVIEKYAVTVGGAFNHRFNLSDAVMIKDNHIKAVGSIKEAVKRSREFLGHTVKIEVEVTNFLELDEAIEAGADIIMLDNMSTEDMAKAVAIVDSRAILEASGGITLERIKEISEVGVDVISVGALTHSAKALDISMNIKQ